MAKKYNSHNRYRRRPHADRNDIGLDSERRFEAAMNFYHGSYPDFLLRIRRAQRGFDSKGTDYVGETKAGIGLPLNIKTNKHDVAAALQNYPDIPCFVVHRGERRESIFERAVRFFEDQYTGQREQHIT